MLNMMLPVLLINVAKFLIPERDHTDSENRAMRRPAISLNK
jgi:hypothetical protein